jgi:predicted GIY-YIG superfamily endonuclease
MAAMEYRDQPVEAREQLKRTIAPSCPTDRTVYIYALCSPGTGNIRYIGKTVNLKTRLAAHYRERGTKYNMNPCKKWIDQLKKEGQRPDVLVLEETTSKQWQERERQWISTLIEHGVSLLNVSSGGHSGKWIKTYGAWSESPADKSDV